MTTPCPGESALEDQVRRMLPDETTEPNTTAAVDLIHLAPTADAHRLPEERSGRFERR